ncbi:hypothetical protein B0H14DRAFT_94982 [Mycena olivaceomarginata]|nr:hypothetical protein B0H14DRAFT_94982 [Mycena olivaceomarginata]
MLTFTRSRVLSLSLPPSSTESTSVTFNCVDCHLMAPRIPVSSPYLSQAISLFFFFFSKKKIGLDTSRAHSRRRKRECPTDGDPCTCQDPRTCSHVGSLFKTRPRHKNSGIGRRLQRGSGVCTERQEQAPCRAGGAREREAQTPSATGARDS